MTDNNSYPGMENNVYPQAPAPAAQVPTAQMPVVQQAVPVAQTVPVAVPVQTAQAAPAAVPVQTAQAAPADKTKSILLWVLIPLAVVVALVIGGCAGYCIHLMNTVATDTAPVNETTEQVTAEEPAALEPETPAETGSYFVSPLDQLKNANVGDLIYITNDKSYTWRVLARDAGKVLMYETFENRKPDNTYDLSDVKSDMYWTIDGYTTNYYFTDREFTRHFVKPGTFIPDSDLYSSYIRHTDNFVSDGYPWVIIQGRRRRFEGSDKDYYNLRYIGIDDMLNGDKGNGKFVFRVFVWVDVSD